MPRSDRNALAALLPAALATGSAGADRAVRDGLAAGMKAAPILVGVAPATSDPAESPTRIELKGPTLEHDLRPLTTTRISSLGATLSPSRRVRRRA